MCQCDTDASDGGHCMREKSSYEMRCTRRGVCGGIPERFIWGQKKSKKNLQMSKKHAKLPNMYVFVNIF